MNKQLIKILLYVGLLLVTLIGVQLWTQSPQRHFVPVDGRVDLTGVDMAQEIVDINEDGWEYYPEHLYTPTDFRSGATTGPVYNSQSSPADYGTYRLKVKLPKDILYAVTGESFSFSHRVFINGELVDEVGLPGSSRQDTVAQITTYTYFFQPHDGEAELIYQAANFNHKGHGYNNTISLGEPELVFSYRAKKLIYSTLLVGGFAFIFLYFSGLYIFFFRRLYFLFLALASLVTAVRMAFFDEYVMMPFPDLSWSYPYARST